MFSQGRGKTYTGKLLVSYPSKPKTTLEIVLEQGFMTRYQKAVQFGLSKYEYNRRSKKGREYHRRHD